MEAVEDVVIVGAGIAGLAAALGLHRSGMRSLILESSDSLRVTGYAIGTWTNAWRALDVLGIGDKIRKHHVQVQGVVSSSLATGLPISHVSFNQRGKCGEHEVRCVKRKLLVEVLENELPKATIRFGSKVVSIEEEENLKLVHLADGSVIKAKALIGCDGVNSVVAKWLGLHRPVFTGRWAIRGMATFGEGHGFEPKFMMYIGDGFRSGFTPCDDKSIYWFFSYSSNSQDGDCDDPLKVKEFVLSRLHKLPERLANVVKRTELGAFVAYPLIYRHPWNLLWGDIYRGSVCVAGDAFHPMTPEIAQGGCSALEDAVILARCLGEVMFGPSKVEPECDRIKRAVEKYAKVRRCRSIKLITTAYVVGFVQQMRGKVANFLRSKFLGSLMRRLLLNSADFDCGKLYSP